MTLESVLSKLKLVWKSKIAASLLVGDKIPSDLKDRILIYSEVSSSINMVVSLAITMSQSDIDPESIPTKTSIHSVNERIF